MALSYEGPGTRFVLWAHNGHVSFSPAYSYYTMGAHLKGGPRSRPGGRGS